MDKNTLNMRNWSIYFCDGEYRLNGTADYAPTIGRNADIEARFSEVESSLEEDVLICDTQENRYVCPLKYMNIKPYENKVRKHVKELSKRSKKSDSFVDAVISASAQLTLGRWKGKLAKRILKLHEEGQKELDAMDEAYRQHLMEEVMQYEDSLYIEWQNISNDNLMAYHIGDKVGIIEPKLSVGTYSDSVHYTKYRGEQDDLYIDFRYHDSIFRCYETYLWSDNTTQAIIKNTTEWDISINNIKIEAGGMLVLPWDGSQIHMYKYEEDELMDFDEALDEISRKYGLYDEKFIVAMDSFKGSMTSLEAGQAAKSGIESAELDACVDIVPVADGGEGTVEALSYGRETKVETISVTGPLGKPVEAIYTVIDGDTAIMEMSQAAGITLVPEEKRNPLITTTYGVGEMIVHAVESGCTHIIMGIGGSATNDCGIGMLQALGFDIIDNDSKNVCFGANALRDVERISGARVDERILRCKFTIACDVDNPLTGELGCSRIFAPQKGATAAMVEDMDRWIEHFVEVAEVYGVDNVGAECESKEEKTFIKDIHLAPGAGAAGGLGYAFLRFLGGELKSGADIVIEQLELEQKIKESTTVIVGEGSLDIQTTMGKIPGAIAKLGKKHGKRVIAIAGVVKDMEQLQATGLFDQIIEIDRGDMNLEEAMVKENAMANLEKTVREKVQSVVN